MRRREFLGVLGVATAWPQAAYSQSGGMRRLAILFGSSTKVATPFLVAVRKRLSESGWTDGRNLRIDVHWGEGDPDRLSALAAEIVGSAPDVVLAQSTLALDAVRRATETTPIVFTQVSDPVRGGYVSNLAHPEKNITGFTNFEYEMSGKWLETLKEVAPRTSTVLVLADPSVSGTGHLAALQAVASRAAVQLTSIVFSDTAAVKAALDVAAKTPDTGAIALPGTSVGVHRKLIIDWADRDDIGTDEDAEIIDMDR